MASVWNRPYVPHWVQWDENILQTYRVIFNIWTNTLINKQYDLDTAGYKIHTIKIKFNCFIPRWLICMWPLLMSSLFSSINVINWSLISWHFANKRAVAKQNDLLCPINSSISRITFAAIKAVWIFTKSRGRLQVSGVSVVCRCWGKSVHLQLLFTTLSRLSRHWAASSGVGLHTKHQFRRHKVSAETLKRRRLSLVRACRSVWMQ